MWRLNRAYADTYLTAANPFDEPVRVVAWVQWENGQRKRIEGSIAPNLTGRWGLNLASTIDGPLPAVLNGSVLVWTDPNVPIERATWDDVPSEGGRSETTVLEVRCR